MPFLFFNCYILLPFGIVVVVADVFVVAELPEFWILYTRELLVGCEIGWWKSIGLALKRFIWFSLV